MFSIPSGSNGAVTGRGSTTGDTSLRDLEDVTWEDREEEVSDVEETGEERETLEVEVLVVAKPETEFVVFDTAVFVAACALSVESAGRGAAVDPPPVEALWPAAAPPTTTRPVDPPGALPAVVVWPRWPALRCEVEPLKALVFVAANLDSGVPALVLATVAAGVVPFDPLASAA